MYRIESNKLSKISRDNRASRLVNSRTIPIVLRKNIETGGSSPYVRFSFGSLAPKENFRVISTARLNTLLRVHLPPIYVVVFNDPLGNLILWLASRLDAFSAYPYQTRLPSDAPGGTTGTPEVCPTRSSRTSVRTTQISCAHNR